MSLETGDFIKDLVQSNPEGTDPKSRGDDHLRLLKHVLLTQFSGFTQGKPITLTEDQLNSAVLKGVYGIGGAAKDITETEMSVGDLPCGFYYVSAQGLSALPVNENGFLWQIDISNPGFALQFYTSVGGENVYHRELRAGSFRPWYQHWDSHNTPKQSAYTDPTEGCMATTRSFGIGVPLPAASGQDVNVSWGLGNQLWMGSNWANRPGGAASDFALADWIVCNTDGTYGRQNYFDCNTGREWQRGKSSGGFGAWAEVLTSLAWFINSPSSYFYLGPLVIQFGSFSGPIADEGTATVNFPATTAQTLCMLCQIWGAHDVNVTFHDLYVTFLSTTGANVVHRTNGSTALAGFYWCSIGIRA